MTVAASPGWPPLGDGSTGNGRFEGGEIELGPDGDAHRIESSTTTTVTSYDLKFPATVTKAGMDPMDGHLAVFDSSTGEGWFRMDGTTLSEDYDGGTIEVYGATASLAVSSIGGGGSRRVTVGNILPIQAVLRDDDEATLPDMPNGHTQYLNRFHAACVKPAVDGGVPGASKDDNDIPFVRNVVRSSAEALVNTTPGVFDSRQHIEGSYWVAYVMMAYQGRPTNDGDPNDESTHFGECPDWKYGFIYKEAIRDFGGSLDEEIRRTLVHEIGHEFNIQDESEEGTLYWYETLLDLGTPCPTFGAQHIRTIRENPYPSDPNGL